MFLFYILLCSCAAVTVMGNDDGVETQVITGAYVKNMGDMSIYSAKIPQFYVKPVKQFEFHHVTAVLSKACNGNNDIMCRVYKYVNENLIHLQEVLGETDKSLQIVNIHTYMDPTNMTVKELRNTNFNFDLDFSYAFAQNTRQERSVGDFLGSALSYCCGVVSKTDLTDIFTNDLAVSNFMNHVRDSVIKDHQTLINIHHEVEDLADYTTQSLKSFQSVLRSLTELETRNNANIANNFSYVEELALHNAVLSAQLAQYSLWQQSTFRHYEVVNSCRNKQLSLTLVSRESLQWSLVKLAKQLEKVDYQLTIPLDNLGDYYVKNIVSCKISDERIVVRVDVPIIKKGKYNVYEIITTPMKWRNSTCRIRLEPTYVVTNGVSLVPISGTHLHQCQLTDNLCFVPQTQSDQLRGPSCPSRLFARSTIERLNKACLFECSETTETIVTQIDQDMFVVTHPPARSYVQIGTDKIRLTPPEAGSIQVSLPCGASLHLSNRAAPITPPMPCPVSLMGKFQLTHVLPSAWSTVSSAYLSIVSQHEAPTYANMSSVLNVNWTSMPVINLTISENSILKKLKTPRLVHYTYTSSYLSVTFLWNIILTLGLAYLFYRQFGPTTLMMPTFANTFRYANANDTPDHFDLGLMEGIAITVMILNFVFLILFVFLMHCLVRRIIQLKKQRFDNAAAAPLLTDFDIQSPPASEAADFVPRYRRPETIYEEIPDQPSQSSSSHLYPSVAPPKPHKTLRSPPPQLQISPQGSHSNSQSPPSTTVAAPLIMQTSL